MGKSCSCTQFIKSRIFYYKSRENLYQVLQVTCAASERAMKSKVRTIKSLSPYYQGIPEKKISLICCRWHCYSCCPLITIRMATNFSGIVLYYGDTYIVGRFCELTFATLTACIQLQFLKRLNSDVTLRVVWKWYSTVMCAWCCAACSR